MNNTLLLDIEKVILDLRKLRDDPGLYQNTLKYFIICMRSLSLLEVIAKSENYPSDWEEGKNI